MSAIAHFKLLARYNQQMNESLFEAASQLSHEQLQQDRGAFFGSIIGTMNHIMVGDIIWLQRFAEHPDKFSALESVRSRSRPASLDAIVHTEIESWMIERRKLDNAIVDFSNQLTDTAIEIPLCYSNMAGVESCKNFGQLIQHLFNHQTHHRGQASTLLSQAGIDIGTTDLLTCIDNV